MGNLVSSYKQYWVHPNALTIELNTFGMPNYLQASVSADSVVMAYIPDVIGYGPDGNYRRWTLHAYNTHFTSNSEKYMYLRLDRSVQQTEARVVYANSRLDIYGELYDDSESTDNEGNYWFILLGIISETNGVTHREWTQDYVSGTLDTNEQRNEDSGGLLSEMFTINRVTGYIEVLKQFAALTVHGALTVGSAVVNGILQAATGVFNAIRIGGKDITSVRKSDDTPYADDSDTSISTTADVTKNIRSKALIRTSDATEEESTVHHDLTVDGGVSISSAAQFFRNAVSRVAATFGNFSSAVAGHITGASIDSNGMGMFANLRANSMEVFELILNRIRANGGRQVFSGASGKIDSVELYEEDEENGDKYILHMHADADNPNDKTEFAEGDIMYAYVNNINSGAASSTGQCWMHVLSVNTSGDSNYVIAQMYRETNDNGDPLIPVSVNLVPTENMVVAQWGNVYDTDRQTSFYIDTESGNIIQLMNVDSPIIGLSNYGAIMGKLPEDLRDYIYAQGGGVINEHQPYFFGRGAVLQDVIQVDYLGQIVRTQRDRGAWDSVTAAKTAAQGGYTVTNSTYDVVTHNGGLYKCIVDYPNTASAEPGTNASQWMLILESNTLGGNGMYEVVAFPNSLNVHQDRISPQSDVSVYVRKLTVSGVEEIGDSEDLADLGMRIEYSIDDGERQELVISDGEISDDSGESIIGDNEVPLLHLEGENIDASTVQDHISIFLVSYWDEEDESGETVEKTKDISEVAIIVMKDGEPGGQGYSITDMKEVYALIPDEVTNVNSTNVDEVTSEYGLVWSEIVPTWQSGYNLWNAMRTVYGEDDSVVFHDFENLGEGVTSVTEQYCVMSGLTNPDTYGVSAAWSTTLVQPSSGQSLWNREYRTFVSGGDHEPYTAAKLVTYVGSNGTSFIPLGEAIDSDTTPNNPSAGDYWFDTSVSPAVIRQYDGSAWNVVTLNVGDAFKLASDNHLVVWNGTSWADLGPIGGADGNGITDSYEVWQWTDSDRIDSVDDSNWSNTIGSYTSAKPYLWNATCFEFDRGANLYTDKECLGMGVQNSVEYYCAKPDGIAPTVPTHSSDDVTHAEMVAYGWSLEKPTLNDSTSRVMWNTELVSYIDSRKTHCTTPSNIYRYTVDGTVISDITEVYALVNDNVTVNAQNASSYSWGTTIPQWQNGKNLWNAMRIVYGGLTKYYDFDNLGKGVSNTIEEYAISVGLVEPSASSWSTTKPSTLEKGEALWNREHIVYIDGRTGVAGRPDYTDASLITYIGSDGTKFIPRGVAYSSINRTWSVGEFYYDSSESDASDGLKRCITGGSSSNASFEVVSLDEGDAYKIEETGHLLVWDGTTWVDLGSIVGPQGNSGISIRESSEVYQWTNSSSKSSVNDSNWTSQIPTYNSNKPYLWNATKILYDDGSYDYVSIECLGDGVSSVLEYYKAGQDSDVSIPVPTKQNADVTQSDMVNAGWSLEKPLLTESLPCMWNTELRSFYDGRYASCTPSAIVFRYSKDGINGNGIALMQERYLLIPPDESDPYNYFLSNIEDSQTEAYYDEDNPDYDLWNALYIEDTNGNTPVLFDLEYLGAGVKNVTEYYRLTETGETPSFGVGTIGQWGTSKADVTAARTSDDHYLWNAELIEYRAESKPVRYTDPALVGYYAVDGVSFNILDNIHSATYITAQHVETYPGLTYFNFVNDVVSVYQYGNDGNPHVIGSQGMAYRTIDEPLENHLIYHNGTKWIDLGSIVGPKGDPGDDGRPATKIRLSSELTSIPIDPETHKTISATSIMFTAQVFYGTSAVAIDSYSAILQGSSVLTPPTGQVVSITKTLNGNTLTVRINIPKDTEASVSTAYARVSLMNVQYGITGEYADFAIIFVERGKVGPIGENGLMLYPSGVYDTSVIVSLGDNGYLNDGVSTPYVLDEDGNYYWRTEYPYRKSDRTLWSQSDDISSLASPSVDYANGGNSAWRLIRYQESVFTKILFSNFANLGNAVFYGKYMFSEKGQKPDGTICNYSDVEGIDGQHIFTDGKLNGTWIPSLFIDYSSGMLRSNKMSEPFLEMPLEKTYNNEEYDSCYNAIDMDGCHNLSVVPRCNFQTDGFSPSPALVVLPRRSENWAEDGAHCTIIHQFEPHFAVMGEGRNDSPTYLTESSVVIVCADDRILKASTYGANTPYLNVLDQDSDAWIIWNGKRCKFVILSVGAQLYIRSCRTKTKEIINGEQVDKECIYWYIENGDEFEEVSAYIAVQSGTTHGSGMQLGAFFPHNNTGGGEIFPIIGSHNLTKISATRNSGYDIASGYKMGYIMFTGVENGEHVVGVLEHYN